MYLDNNKCGRCFYVVKLNTDGIISARSLSQASIDVYITAV